jgi:hypothetical protein
VPCVGSCQCPKKTVAEHTLRIPAALVLIRTSQEQNPQDPGVVRVRVETLRRAAGGRRPARSSMSCVVFGEADTGAGHSRPFHFPPFSPGVCASKLCNSGSAVFHCRNRTMVVPLMLRRETRNMLTSVSSVLLHNVNLDVMLRREIAPCQHTWTQRQKPPVLPVLSLALQALHVVACSSPAIPRISHTWRHSLGTTSWIDP